MLLTAVTLASLNKQKLSFTENATVTYLWISQLLPQVLNLYLKFFTKKPRFIITNIEGAGVFWDEIRNNCFSIDWFHEWYCNWWCLFLCLLHKLLLELLKLHKSPTTGTSWQHKNKTIYSLSTGFLFKFPIYSIR